MRDEEKVQHCITIMIPACRKNRSGCSQLAAAICESREQGLGLPGPQSSGVGNGAEVGLKAIQAMRVIGNGCSSRKQASKSRKKFSEG